MILKSRFGHFSSLYFVFIFFLSYPLFQIYRKSHTLYFEQYIILNSIFVNIQVRKEPEKTPVPTVIIATDKAKEQERISRAREVSSRHEQVHIAHEKVSKDVIDFYTLTSL